MCPLQVSPEATGAVPDARDAHDEHDREYRKTMHLGFHFFSGKMHGGTNAVANCQCKLEGCGRRQKAKPGFCEC